MANAELFHPEGVDPIVAAHRTLLSYKAARARNAELKDDMTLLKLIKMVYVAHGYHLAILDAPLVSGGVEAWEKGPVIPRIYAAAMFLLPPHLRKLPLRASLFSMFVETMFPVLARMNDSSVEIIDKVNEVFGALDGERLSRATHAPSSPWNDVYEEGKQVRMADALIREHYLHRRRNDGQEKLGL